MIAPSLGALATSLSGYRVLDLSRVLAGPFCAQHLADLGADVVKVEEPGQGDETRGWGPPFAGEYSAYFLSCNRGKRSLALNLTRPEDQALLQRLVAKADVLLENFRPASLAKLGLDRQQLKVINPKLVIASFSGFGRDGAYADRPGYDFVAQAMSGMMAVTGPEGGAPHKLGVAIVDIVAGLYAASGIMAALLARHQSGQGLALEVALLDCAVASMANVAQSYLVTGQEPRRYGNAHAQIVPYELFRCQDGWLVLAVGNDEQWQRFCSVSGEQSLGREPRFLRNQDRVKQRADLIPRLQALMLRQPVAHWESTLQRVQVPCAPLWNFAQLFASQLAAERRLTMTARTADGLDVTLLRSPLCAEPPAADHRQASTPRAVRPPPRLGEHHDQVLADWLGHKK